MKKSNGKDLDSWEWTTVVSSWRYMEGRMSISSSMFPGELVERYFGPNNVFSDKARETIAHQFVEVDYRKGSMEYDGISNRDDDGFLRSNKKEYLKLWCFLDAYLHGFAKVVTKYEGKMSEHDAFEFDGNWVDSRKFSQNPFVGWYIGQEYIVSINGEKVHKKHGARK